MTSRPKETSTSTTSPLHTVPATCGHEKKVLRFAFRFAKFHGPCDSCWHYIREDRERLEQERINSRDK